MQGRVDSWISFALKMRFLIWIFFLRKLYSRDLKELEIKIICLVLNCQERILAIKWYFLFEESDTHVLINGMEWGLNRQIPSIERGYYAISHQ